MARIKKENYGGESVNFGAARGGQAAGSYAKKIIVVRSSEGFKMKCLAALKISLLGCFWLFAVGCAGLDFNSGAPLPVTSGENARSTENAGTDTVPAAEMVRKAYEKMDAVRSYRVRHELNGGTGSRLTSTMEFVAPDRMRAIQPEMEVETITIGGDVYIKTSGSAWQKSDLLSLDPDDLPKGNDIFSESFKNFVKEFEVKAIGSETVDKMPVNVFECTSKQEKDQIKIKLWIGKRDNLIHQMETEFDMSLDGEKPAQIKSVYKFYDFGADIKIVPPM